VLNQKDQDLEPEFSFLDRDLLLRASLFEIAVYSIVARSLAIVAGCNCARNLVAVARYAEVRFHRNCLLCRRTLGATFLNRL
jgi:hypothetical protein